MKKCAWPLGNGTSLTFDVCSENKNWRRVAGIYIFAYLASDGSWRPVYVGQTDDFSSRLPSHEKLEQAIRAGATHIHALVVPLQTERDLYERALIQTLQPQLNDNFRTRRST